MRTNWDELLRGQLRNNKVLQKSLFSYKKLGYCMGLLVYPSCQAVKYNVILTAGAGALRVSGSKVQTLILSNLLAVHLLGAISLECLKMPSQ